MKTPREILFERHRQAEPRLDAVRQKALAVLRSSESVDALQPGHGAGPFKRRTQNAERGIMRATRQVGAVLRKAWLELVWPSRRAWAGIAALWLVVLAANLEMKATFPAAPAVRAAPTRELVQAMEEQRRLLAELLQPPSAPPAEPPRPSPRPRSERVGTNSAC